MPEENGTKEANELTFAAMQDADYSSKGEKMYRLGVAAILAEHGIVLRHLAPNSSLEYEAVDTTVAWADGRRQEVKDQRRYHIVYKYSRAVDISRLEISEEQYRMLQKLRFSEYYNGGKLTPGTSIHGGGYITQQQIQYLQDNITKFYK